ncbi:mannose-1-phosphate guanylyltransferase/mannose-6-phosphate isomerase, partial [Salmonella enterica]|nr:mannose-1-phosphate guanylyltransferase/mannose-6-phosphate isomerase [Salmonella enterica]
MSNIQPVILCGGSGTRLWPLSREEYPKQFLKINSTESMLQRTISRLNGLSISEPVIICNEKHRFIIAEQLRGTKVNRGCIILEPMGRNTAPAIALAALNNIRKGSDPLMLVLAADHIIKDNKAFCASVECAAIYAEKGKLVTFGIVPTYPETGYGYIKCGSPIANDPSVNVSKNLHFAYNVSAFVEKPDIERAELYLSNKDYYWNSGIFLFRASIYLRELEKYRPDILDVCSRALNESSEDLDFIRIEPNIFSNCLSDSIDYAVMEKTTDAIVVPVEAGWSDVGSWSSVWDITDKDKNNNVLHGDIISLDTKNSYLYSENCLLTTIGVNNLVVVSTRDAILVADKNSTQNVKYIVDTIKNNSRYEYFNCHEIYQSWGKYKSLASGERYHVKHIIVKPSERTTFQVHNDRSKYWIIITGAARVILGNEVRFVSENESVYIPFGVPHGLENSGDIPLELIEVRSGNYIAEDDVVRLKG